LVLQILNILLVLLILLSLVVLLGVDLDVEEEVEEALLLDLLGLLLFLLVLLLDDLDGDVLALLPGDGIAEALLDLLAVQLELLVQLGIGEPLVLTEVEIHPQLLQVLTLARLDSLQVLQQGLIALLDLLAHHVAVGEDLQPELRDLLSGEVVVLQLVLLLSQQLPHSLKVRIREPMLARGDVVDLPSQGRKSLTESPLDSLDLPLQLPVQSPLLDEVAIESNGLHLLGKRWQRLDFVLDLRLDVDLRGMGSTSSSSSS
jgi:hypothetical protein